MVGDVKNFSKSDGDHYCVCEDITAENIISDILDSEGGSFRLFLVRVELEVEGGSLPSARDFHEMGSHSTTATSGSTGEQRTTEHIWINRFLLGGAFSAMF